MGLKDQIVRAAFNGVEFPCLEVRDSRANDVVEHKAWRVPGADLEFTGRGPLVTHMRAGLLNGMTGTWPADLFPGLYDRLLSEFLEHRQGELTHPYYGTRPFHFKTFDVAYDPACQQGVNLELEFVENNGSAFYGIQVPQEEPGAALTSNAEAADAAVAAIVPDAKPIAPVVDTQLAYLEAGDRGTAEAFGAIAEIHTAAESLLALPALAGTTGHAARAALRAVERAAWAYRARYLSPAPQSRVFVVQAPMGLARIAALALGSASKLDTIRRANVIPNEMLVPAGTALKIPDAE